MTSLARDLILECYHSPTTIQRLANSAVPLPLGIERVLQDVVETWQQNNLIEEAAAHELRRALLYFAKNVMFLEEGDYYRTLALQPDARRERVEQHYRWLLALLQSDTQESALNLSQYVIRISRAVAMLGDSGQRRLYDRTLFGPLAGERIDINVDDVVEGLLVGTPSNGLRPRQTVDAEYTVEIGEEVLPDFNESVSGSKVADKEVAEARSRSGRRSGLTRYGSGLVMGVLLVLAVQFWKQAGNDEPPRVTMSSVEVPASREAAVRVPASDAMIAVDMAPVPEPFVDVVESVTPEPSDTAAVLPDSTTSEPTTEITEPLDEAMAPAVYPVIDLNRLLATPKLDAPVVPFQPVPMEESANLVASPVAGEVGMTP